MPPLGKRKPRPRADRQWYVLAGGSSWIWLADN